MKRRAAVSVESLEVRDTPGAGFVGVVASSAIHIRANIEDPNERHPIHIRANVEDPNERHPTHIRANVEDPNLRHRR
jgi:hypothetical protein